MNTQKLTQKSIEVITNAQNIAIENQNQQICPLHALRRHGSQGCAQQADLSHLQG